MFCLKLFETTFIQYLHRPLTKIRTDHIQYISASFKNNILILKIIISSLIFLINIITNDLQILKEK